MLIDFLKNFKIFLLLLVILIPITSYCSERRAMPAPFDSVFPITEYPGPTIGVPNTDPIYPLTCLLWRSPCLRENDIRVYGWLNPSFNLSTSHHSNIPLGYDIVPKRVELDQFVFIIERQPDTVQMDHCDWGFKITNLFGIDYRFTTAQGFFSEQLLKHNNLYGYDPVELYWQYYNPCIANGLLFTIGRFLSPVDIESALAPDNFLFTHSLMFTYDITTMTGITAAIMLDCEWTLLLGVHAGGDVAPWVKPAHIPSFLAMLRWVSCDNNDSLWGGIASVNNGYFRAHHDNLQEFTLTWSHRFCPTFFTMTEVYYLYQYDALLGGTCNDGPERSFGGGHGCGPLLPGTSQAWGAVNYIEYKLSCDSFVTSRIDYLNDVRGERTGFATKYWSYTLGIYYTPYCLLTIRPEIRFERADSDVKPYDNGTRREQTTFGIDMILRF